MKYTDIFIKTLKKLGINIKNQREKKNLLSNLTGIRTSYIRKIELGNAYGVKMGKHLFKIAKAMDIKMSELLNFE